MENLFSEVELRTNNPYSTGEIFTFPEGDVLLDRKPLNYIKSIRDRYYTVKQEDNISNIAFQAYGNSKWWWVIADINKLDNPFDLKMGSTLLIADLDKLLISNS